MEERDRDTGAPFEWRASVEQTHIHQRLGFAGLEAILLLPRTELDGTDKLTHAHDPR